MSDRAKHYDPATVEAKWSAHWEEQGFFHADADPARTRFPKGPYTVVIPPPNVTGVLHMGHMLNNTIQDVLVRRKRMEGYNALWVPGTDHASIATEAKVVRMLRDEGTSKGELGRDAFLDHAWAWTRKYGGIILKQLRRLGASVDWRRTRFTMEPALSQAVINTFVDLHEKGLIYRAERMVNWDPVGRTALSDEEVVYKERTDQLYRLRYDVFVRESLQTPEQPLGSIVIATTRPETILADWAIAIHPEDEDAGRRAWVEKGAYAQIPLVERPIPIIEDAAVDREFGTGALKITPAHDKTDQEIYQRHKDSVPGLPIDILNEDGTLNKDCGIPEYVGMDRFAVRKAIVERLRAAGHLVKVEDIHHSVGHSERTDAVIEPRLSLQWWVRMRKFADVALQAVDNADVQLVPADRFTATYRNWLLNVKDWCISRQLWWGHRIPAFFLRNAEHPNRMAFIIRKEHELEEPINYIVAATAQEAYERLQKIISGMDGEYRVFQPIDSNFNYDEFVRSIGVTDLQAHQDEDVLDTWFSSWLWPWSVFLPDPNAAPGKEPAQPGDLDYFYPTQTLVTAPEILFFWVARMVMAGYEYRGQAPFQHVYLTGIVRDKQGRKMSKSLGNSPEPLDLMDRYSTDGVRAGMLFSSQAGNDIMFDESLCEQGRNFANKIWNAFRLVSAWQDGLADTPAEPRQQLALDWMRSRLAEAATELTLQFSQFRLSEALLTVYKLIWDDFCAWFLELAKPAPGQGYPRALYAPTLDLFEGLVQLLHPFMPFITEEIWHGLRPRDARDCLTVAPLRSFGHPDASLTAGMAHARELTTALRAFRAERGISAKQPLALHVRTANPDFYQRFLPAVGKLAGVEAVHFVDAPLAGAFALVVRGDELYLPLAAAAVDLDAERARLQQEIDYTAGFLDTVRRKLANEKFVANAKPDLVDRERQKQADAEAKLQALRQSLAAMG